ncbi:hypothetical protein ACG7TL_008395 [Trametes sanguinea]
MPNGDLPYPYILNPDMPATPHNLGDFCIDELRPMKVIVIGAGYSGVTAGIRSRQKLPNVQLTIYEKSAGIGGAWFNNRYPGLTCDVPSHCYQLSFEEKKDWSALYASGPEIRRYIEDVAAKYKLTSHIRLDHEVVRARYDEPSGQWHVRIRRVNAETGVTEEFEDTADVLVNAIGSLSRWTWPNMKGLKDFKGELHHSAGFDPGDKTWQEVAEAWKDKKVGVIGIGSSALQIVTALQPRVKKMFNYVRSKAWLSGPFATKAFKEALGRDPENAADYAFTSEEIEHFKNDPKFYRAFRLALENEMQSLHAVTLRGSPMQAQARESLTKNMEEKLAKKPWIADKLLPEFPVACRRLTPGPGYLEALCADNAEFVTTPIRRITESGVETVDGNHEELDVIFCATGYETSYRLPFEVIGRNGLDLNTKWTPHPVTYLSVAVDGFPNMFHLLGPNANVGTGSLLAIMEFQVAYAVQATAKLQRERLKSIEVKPEAVRDFDSYIEAYFPKSVYSEKCPSWFKMGKDEGRIVGLWPGSSLHAMRALSHPRWEDYNYEPLDPVDNRLHWLGDGQTYAEKTMSGDRVWYLREPYLDVPPVPED